jgi:hypothetical protein
MSAMSRKATEAEEWEELTGERPDWVTPHPVRPTRTCIDCGHPVKPHADRCQPCWTAWLATQTPEARTAMARAMVAAWERPPFGPSLDERMSAVDRQYADDRARDRAARHGA